MQDLHSSDVDLGREASSQSQQLQWWLSDLPSGSDDSLILPKETQFWNIISPCRSNSFLGNSVLQCGFGRCSSQWVYVLHIPLLKLSVLKLARVESIVCIEESYLIYTISTTQPWVLTQCSQSFPSTIKSLWHPERGTPCSSLTSSFPDLFSPLRVLIFHMVRKWTAL